MGISDRKEREKEQRRQAILDAAKNIFFIKGYDKTSMMDIAREAELSKGTLYLYFKNKEELAGAIMNEILSRILTMVREGIAGIGKTIEKIRAIADAHITFIKEHRDYYRFMQYSDSIIPEVITPDSPFATSLEKLDSLIDIFENLISEGIKDGSVKSRLNPKKAAITYVHIAYSFLSELAARGRIIYHHRGYNEQEMLEQLFDILIESLKTV